MRWLLLACLCSCRGPDAWTVGYGHGVTEASRGGRSEFDTDLGYVEATWWVGPPRRVIVENSPPAPVSVTVEGHKESPPPEPEPEPTPEEKLLGAAEKWALGITGALVAVTGAVETWRRKRKEKKKA